MDSRLIDLLRQQTPLVPPRQTDFGAETQRLYSLWAMLHQVPQSNDYDMRGFYAGMLTGDPAATTGMNPSDMQMHFNDKWKLPNHPSFSNESMYSRGLLDPHWVANPAPYRDGTWGLLGGGNYKTLEIPK